MSAQEAKPLLSAWAVEEDKKYSFLYVNRQYPPGHTSAVLKAFGYQPADRTVDLGCGRAALRDTFASYVGIDVSAVAIAENRKLPGAVFYHASLDDLTCLKGQSFDLAICSDVLEHIPPERLSEVLRAISEVNASRHYFNVCCRPSMWKDEHGGPLHLSVLRPQKWLDVLGVNFRIVETRLKGHSLLVHAKSLAFSNDTPTKTVASAPQPAPLIPNPAMMNVPPSLAKDGHDQRALHSPVWREELDTAVRGLGETSPFFYTRTGAALPLEGLYRGAHAFLIANGTSVRDLDLAPLERCWTMTLNNGPRTFRGQANITVDDPSRFSASIWLDPTIMKFVPLGQMEKTLWDNRMLRTEHGWEQRWEPSKIRVGECPNVVGYRRNEKFHAARWLHEETVNWGNHEKHGGGRSVLLAALRILYLLGFRHVHLLGVDFDMSAEKRYHFDEGRSANAVKNNQATYAKLQTWFSELQPLFLKAGFHVTNCNPKSLLTAFPYQSYPEALEEASLIIGDPSREETVGMYDETKVTGFAVKNAQQAVPEMCSVLVNNSRNNDLRHDAMPELFIPPPKRVTHC